MFDDQAFQQDKLIVELKESDIVKRPVSSTSKTLGVALVNHNRNNNVRIQIRPKRSRPILPSPAPTHQNPTAFIDDARGELNMCLTHSDKFIISCAGAPKHYVFASSFGQMVADLARNNPNISIYINDTAHRSEEFISGSGTTLSFNPQFLEQYGITYTDMLGNYRMEVSGARTARFELRVLAPGNGMSPNQVATLFGQSTTEINDTVVYHSNTDFYGFTFCIESSSVPSLTRIDYATFETMEELITSGVITEYHDEATNLTIQTTTVGEESKLDADFKARLLNSFDETPVRKQDYLLVLESPDFDLTTLDLTKLRANYDIYQVGAPAPVAPMAMRTMSLMSTAVTASTENPEEGTLLESGIVLDTAKLYRLNGKVVYPMTMAENDNGRYLKFRIDFDGEAGLFTEAEHRLNIHVNKAADVTIPLLVDYETDIPNNLSNLSYAIFDRHQFYQFAVNMHSDSLLYIELPEMNPQNVEISIPNKATLESIPTYEDHVSPIGHARGWHSAVDQLVVIQLKVPIGVTGTVKIVQRGTKDVLNGLMRSDSGKLSPIVNDTITTFTRNSKDATLRMRGVKVNQDYSHTHSFIQLFDELHVGQAIALSGLSYVHLTQGISSLRDYTRDNGAIRYERGKTGSWISINGGGTVYDYVDHTNASGTITATSTSAGNKYIIIELLETALLVHYYILDENLVPVVYLGNSTINWVYDNTSPVSVIGVAGSQNNIYLGTAYDVNEGDLGPLRSDFVLSHTYDIRITDITEV